MIPQIENVDEPQGQGEPSSELRIAEYWSVIVKHRRLIVLCVLAALTVGALVSVLSPPKYRAVATIAAEKEQVNPIDPGWRPRIYGGMDPEFLPTQARIIKSRANVEKVVQKLQLIDRRELNPKRSGLFRTGLGPPRPGTASSETNSLVHQIRSNVIVEPIRGTNLVELTYVGPSPGVAAEVANALAQQYIAWNAEARSQQVGQASEFLDSEIEALRQEVGAKEEQLLAYGRQKDILSTDPQANVSFQKLEAVNSDYAGAVADRVTREAKYHELRNARSETVAQLNSSALVDQLRAEQSRLERDYAEKLNLFKPEWPAMQQLKGQIERVRQNLEAAVQEASARAREAARADYMSALRREESLKGMLRTQKSEAQASNTNALEYNNLRSEVDTKKAMLDALSKRRAETEVMSRFTKDRTSNVRIVDLALPPSARFKPSYSKNGAVALVGGLILGVALSFLLSYLDRSLRTVEQVEQYLHLPALGVIPAVRSDSEKKGGYVHRLRSQGGKREEEPAGIELLPHLDPRSRVAERYRAFRTALLLSRAGGVGSIVITSCFSREGKTATAANLAVVLGQLGKRVLLVDADLHRPRLHEVFRVSNRVGLVSVLAENLEPARAIVKTHVPEVFLVPSGPATPNPSGLLSSEAMAKFLELSRLNFDYLILDAPPVAPVADALILGYRTDGVVVCVRGGETPRDQVAKVRDKLLRSDVRILGILLNNFEEEPEIYGKRYAYDTYYAEQAAYTGSKRAAPVAKTL